MTGGYPLPLITMTCGLDVALVSMEYVFPQSTLDTAGFDADAHDYDYADCGTWRNSARRAIPYEMGFMKVLTTLPFVRVPMPPPLIAMLTLDQSIHRRRQRAQNVLLRALNNIYSLGVSDDIMTQKADFEKYIVGVCGVLLVHIQGAYMSSYLYSRCDTAAWREPFVEDQADTNFICGVWRG